MSKIGLKSLFLALVALPTAVAAQQQQTSVPDLPPDSSVIVSVEAGADETFEFVDSFFSRFRLNPTARDTEERMLITQPSGLPVRIELPGSMQFEVRVHPVPAGSIVVLTLRYLPPAGEDPVVINSESDMPLKSLWVYSTFLANRLSVSLNQWVAERGS